MISKFAVVLMLLTVPQLFAQNGFQTSIPDEPVSIQIFGSQIYTTGHWVDLDEKSQLTGPSVSEITCDRQQKACSEKQANMQVMGDLFGMTADYIEYKVERWTASEIVASNVSGDCRVRHVLKFDLVKKRVFASDTLSEPVENLPKFSKDACKLVGLNLELKAPTMWKK